MIPIPTGKRVSNFAVQVTRTTATTQREIMRKCLLTVPSFSIPGTAQITVLYDALGKTPGMQKDWGYSALIEYAGKRILFDTGNNPQILEQNAKARRRPFVL
jgi:hypothetical protein